MMTLEEAIKSRRSVRSYAERPVEPEKIDTLNRLVEEINASTGLNFSLVTDEPDAFGRSLMARYGKFSGVRNYFCLAAPSDTASKEAVGYNGERLVLEARRLGLDTCWVGMTVKKRLIPVKLRHGDKIHAVIAVGYGTVQGSDHKRKLPCSVAPDYDRAPEWFRHGVDLALLAPTALNQQKFKIFLDGDKVKMTAGRGFYTSIDLGIARLHFEIGAAIRQ